MKQEPVQEIIVPLEERGNIKQIKTIIIIKMEYYKISKLLNNSTVLKFVTKKMDQSKSFIKCSIFF